MLVILIPQRLPDRSEKDTREASILPTPSIEREILPRLFVYSQMGAKLLFCFVTMLVFEVRQSCRSIFCKIPNPKRLVNFIVEEGGGRREEGPGREKGGQTSELKSELLKLFDELLY